MKKTPLIIYVVMGFAMFLVGTFILWLISIPFTNPWYWRIWIFIFNIENELILLIVFLLFAFLHVIIVSIIGSMILPEKIKKRYPNLFDV